MWTIIAVFKGLFKEFNFSLSKREAEKLANTLNKDRDITYVTVKK